MAITKAQFASAINKINAIKRPIHGKAIFYTPDAVEVASSSQPVESHGTANQPPALLNNNLTSLIEKTLDVAETHSTNNDSLSGTNIQHSGTINQSPSNLSGTHSGTNSELSRHIPVAHIEHSGTNINTPGAIDQLHSNLSEEPQGTHPEYLGAYPGAHIKHSGTNINQSGTINPLYSNFSGTISGTRTEHSGTTSGTHIEHLGTNTSPSGTSKQLHSNLSGTHLGTNLAYMETNIDHSGTILGTISSHPGTNLSSMGTHSGTGSPSSGTHPGINLAHTGTSSGTNSSTSGTNLAEEPYLFKDASTHSGINSDNLSSTSGTNTPIQGTNFTSTSQFTGTNSSTSGTNSIAEALHQGTNFVETLPENTALKSRKYVHTTIRGIPFKIMLHLVTNLEDKIRLITKKINHATLALNVEASLDSTKKSLKRLKQKNVITTVEYSTNRYDGYSVFKIAPSFYRTFKERVGVSDSNSNNSNNIIITTTEQKSEPRQANIDLPDDWLEIDLEPLKHIGLSKNHLISLYKSDKTSPKIVQESINHFAWGLINNEANYKKYQNLLMPLIGVLKKGEIWVESKYESPQQLALKKLIALRQAEKERQNKLIEDLIEIEFPQWKKTLSKEEITSIAPNLGDSGFARDVLLKLHFRDEILLPKLTAEGKIKRYENTTT